MISRRSAVIAIALTWAARAAARGADDDIIGIWCEPKGRRSEPLGEWSLTGDDEAIFARGGRIDLTYEIDGNRITTRTGIEPEGSGPTVMTFEANDDTLVLDRSARYGRLRGPYPGVHPLVGEWSITHRNDQRSYLRFSRTGALQLFFPQGQGMTTSYRRNGDHVTIEGVPASFDYNAQKRALIGADGEMWWRFEF